MEPAAYTELAVLENDHWWYQGMRVITNKLMRPILPYRPNASILDAGCGTGGNLLHMAAWGSCSGIDRSGLALDYARQKALPRLAQADVQDLPFQAAVFGLVTSYDVLYAQGVKDVSAAFAEMSRVLAPGGYLFFRAPALSWLRGSHDRFVHGVRRFSAEEVRQYALQAGLTPVRITYVNTLLLPFILLTRMAQRLSLFQTEQGTTDLKPPPHWLNAIVRTTLYLEATLLSWGISLPLGVSIICIARKSQEPLL
jgi:SAM-dependent methyltransferase